MYSGHVRAYMALKYEIQIKRNVDRSSYRRFGSTNEILIILIYNLLINDNMK